MKKISFSLSDKGIEREHNEDTFAFSDEHGIYLVADGMGGYQGGKVASELAANSIMEFFGRYGKEKDFTWPLSIDPQRSWEENFLLTAIKLANRRVYNFGRGKQEYAGMGTTIVALYVYNDEALIANVGDSRGYLIRNHNINQLTTDHTWVSDQIKRKIISEGDARQHRWRNVITRALGNKKQVEIDIVKQEIEAGDYFLLCTDGLTSVIPDQEICQLVVNHKDRVDEACENLIKLARQHGAPDNITIIIVHFLKA